MIIFAMSLQNKTRTKSGIYMDAPHTASSLALLQTSKFFHSASSHIFQGKEMSDKNMQSVEHETVNRNGKFTMHDVWIDSTNQSSGIRQHPSLTLTPRLHAFSATVEWLSSSFGVCAWDNGTSGRACGVVFVGGDAPSTPCNQL